MARARHSSGAGTKSGRFPKGKQNVPAGNPIVDLAAAKASAVAVLKDLLPKDKCAWELHILTGAGLSTCQKLLSGHRELNFDTALSLLRSEHGYELLRELLGDNPPRWFEQLENLDDIAKLKSDQLRMARDLERRERLLIEARAQR